jgi:hypothetical protein
MIAGVFSFIALFFMIYDRSKRAMAFGAKGIGSFLLPQNI